MKKIMKQKKNRTTVLLSIYSILVSLFAVFLFVQASGYAELQETTVSLQESIDIVTDDLEKTQAELDAAQASLAEEQEKRQEAETQNAALQKQYDDLRAAKSMSYPAALGSYSTYFSTGSGREENIRLATEALNGVLLMPGWQISFNDQTGLRTTENGYQPARVIENGVYVDGIGGGVCQVSSTLFNAVLEAGLGIEERHCHSLRSSYVPAGRDATVADNALDFVFSNPYDFPVKLAASAGNGTCTFSVMAPEGHAAPDVEIQVSDLGQGRYLLERSVNGQVDYTTESTYAD